MCVVKNWRKTTQKKLTKKKRFFRVLPERKTRDSIRKSFSKRGCSQLRSPPLYYCAINIVLLLSKIRQVFVTEKAQKKWYFPYSFALKFKNSQNLTELKYLLFVFLTSLLINDYNLYFCAVIFVFFFAQQQHGGRNFILTLLLSRNFDIREKTVR